MFNSFQIERLLQLTERAVLVAERYVDHLDRNDGVWDHRRYTLPPGFDTTPRSPGTDAPTTGTPMPRFGTSV